MVNEKNTGTSWNISCHKMRFSYLGVKTTELSQDQTDQHPGKILAKLLGSFCYGWGNGVVGRWITVETDFVGENWDLLQLTHNTVDGTASGTRSIVHNHAVDDHT